jgi:dGTP triphosphohydrolase
MTVADILGLNVTLCQAIAFGHDIGHVPFGHQGEDFIANRIGRPFTHEVMGLVIAQEIERDGKGLNLCWQVLDGMLRHGGSRASPTMTPEASVVRVCDKIAYIFADYNDLLRVHYPVGYALREAMHSFGGNQRERVNRVIEAFCRESIEQGRMSFEHSTEARDFAELKKLMYEVYGRVTLQDVSRILGPIYDFLEQCKVHDPALLLALMTDRDVMYLHEQRFLNVDHVMQTSVGELIPHLPREIDLCKVDLDW